MSLRLKFGLTEVIRMSVQLASTVPANVKSALVEGDWVKLSAATASSGVPASGRGIELFAVPVDGTASKLSYPIIVNPQSPEHGVPGIGLTVACDRGFIGYTDRFDTGLATNLYTNVALSAHSFVVSGNTRYGLIPATAPEIAAGTYVAWGITVLNGELVFRYLP
jgi:hypothetical protein